MIKPAETALKAANKLLDGVVALILIVVCLFSSYALWDNQQVYAAAEDVMADMLSLKPDAENPGPGFDELRTINPDVCAWVELDGTQVDCPILQGETNLEYINKDVYGEFALAGSVFLDSRNDSSFADAYSLVYGHNMDGGRMLADLELYKEAAFFAENTTGVLIAPEGVYDLEVMACLVVGASEKSIFDPTQWSDANIDSLFAFAESEATCINEDAVAKAKEEGCAILSLTTCSFEFTDARTVVLAAMRPQA